MQKYLLFLFLICFSSAAHAQNTFEKVIDTLGSNYAACIQETFDGGYVYCGKSNNNGNDVIIVKLDSVGFIEWAKTYSGPSIEAASYIEQLPDSGYLVNALFDGGSTDAKTWLLKLDSFGDTLWTKTFSVGVGVTNPTINNSMASVNNSIYGLTGYYNPGAGTNVSAFFIASIGNGFPLSIKTYNPSAIYSTDSRSIDKTYDDGFIMAGGIGTSASTADIYLIRTNTYGDTLWTRTYNSTQNDVAFDVKQTSDSGFVVAGIAFVSLVYNIWLIKTDSVGDTLWSKQFLSPFEEVIHSIEQTNDGGYIMTGYANTATGRSLYLIKTNSLGDTLWTRTFNASIDCSGNFVRQTKDGGFVISGVSYGSYIIKTDSMGIVSSGTGVAVVNNPFDFSVYPNPANGVFTIDVKGIAKDNATIQIYNILNECVYSCKINNKVTEQIDLSNLPNGMYVVKLSANNTNYSKKIIIEK